MCMWSGGGWGVRWGVVWCAEEGKSGTSGREHNARPMSDSEVRAVLTLSSKDNEKGQREKARPEEVSDSKTWEIQRDWRRGQRLEGKTEAEGQMATARLKRDKKSGVNKRMPAGENKTSEWWKIWWVEPGKKAKKETGERQGTNYSVEGEAEEWQWSYRARPDREKEDKTKQNRGKLFGGEGGWRKSRYAFNDSSRDAGGLKCDQLLQQALCELYCSSKQWWKKNSCWSTWTKWLPTLQLISDCATVLIAGWKMRQCQWNCFLFFYFYISKRILESAKTELVKFM